MKGLLEIHFELYEEYQEHYFLESQFYSNDYSYIININIDTQTPYAKIDQEKNQIMKAMNCELADEDVLEKVRDQYDFLENIEFVLIGNTMDEMINYLKKNPELRKKKIIIPIRINTYEQEVLQTLKETLKEFHDCNFYILSSGNEDLISLDEYEQTIEKIDAIVNRVKKYNYSPIEMLMHAYDLVRNRVYKEEEKNERNTISRDVTKVLLLGDKIVCTGYANLYNEVIKKLGFQSKVYNLDLKQHPDQGHARNFVYVKDDKYNIEGLYYFDLTGGSKLTENDQNYLLCYKYFAKTKEQMDFYDKNKYKDINIMLDSHNLEESIQGDSTSYDNKQEVMHTMNYLSRMVDSTTLIMYSWRPNAPKISQEALIDYAYRYEELLNRPIDVDTFLKILFVVRKNEFYEDQYSYPFDIDAFYNALLYSDFLYQDTNEERFLFEIFGPTYQSKKSYEKAGRKMKTCIEEDHLDRRIETIKVAKVFRKIYEKRTN